MNALQPLKRSGGFASVLQIVLIVAVTGVVVLGTVRLMDSGQKTLRGNRLVQTHADRAGAFAQATRRYLVDHSDTLADGVYDLDTPFLQSEGYLNGDFAGETPWGESFIAHVTKNGDTLTALVTEQGVLQSSSLTSVVETPTTDQIRRLKQRVGVRRMMDDPTAPGVPAVVQDGVADGVLGLFNDVNVSSYSDDPTPRLAVLLNVHGTGRVKPPGGSYNLDGLEVTLTSQSTYTSSWSRGSAGSFSWDYVKTKGANDPDTVTVDEVVVRTLAGGGSGNQVYPFAGFNACGSFGHEESGEDTVLDNFQTAWGGSTGNDPEENDGMDGYYQDGHSNWSSHGDGGEGLNGCDDGYAGEHIYRTYTSPGYSQRTFTGTVGQGGPDATGGYSGPQAGESGYVSIKVTWTERFAQTVTLREP